MTALKPCTRRQHWLPLKALGTLALWIYWNLEKWEEGSALFHFAFCNPYWGKVVGLNWLVAHFPYLQLSSAHLFVLQKSQIAFHRPIGRGHQVQRMRGPVQSIQSLDQTVFHRSQNIIVASCHLLKSCWQVLHPCSAGLLPLCQYRKYIFVGDSLVIYHICYALRRLQYPCLFSFLVSSWQTFSFWLMSSPCISSSYQHELELTS